jgi:hypothetical protein
MCHNFLSYLIIFKKAVSRGTRYTTSFMRATLRARNYSGYSDLLFCNVKDVTVLRISAPTQRPICGALAGGTANTSERRYGGAPSKRNLAVCSQSPCILHLFKFSLFLLSSTNFQNKSDCCDAGAARCLFNQPDAISRYSSCAVWC